MNFFGNGFSWKWLRATILLCFVAGVAYLSALLFGPSKYSVRRDGHVLISLGAQNSEITSELVSKNIAPKSFLSRYLIRVFALYKSSLKFGEYEFSENVSLYDALMQISRAAVLQRRILVVEGECFEDTVANINSSYGLIGEDVSVEDMMDKPVLADTYFYTFGEKKRVVFYRMAKALDDFVQTGFDGRSVGCVLNSTKEVITLASIVEKEASIKDERPLVASVYFNRLRKGMRLESDPCVLFAAKKKAMSFKDVFFKSAYNTYRNRGLPPGPICSPGRASIIAVLHPAETDYLFFVSDNNGGHIFAKDFVQHVKNRKWYKKGLARN